MVSAPSFRFEDDLEGRMAPRPQLRLDSKDRAELWRRWKAGESISNIAVALQCWPARLKREYQWLLRQYFPMASRSRN